MLSAAWRYNLSSLKISPSTHRTPLLLSTRGEVRWKRRLFGWPGVNSRSVEPLRLNKPREALQSLVMTTCGLPYDGFAGCKPHDDVTRCSPPAELDWPDVYVRSFKRPSLRSYFFPDVKMVSCMLTDSRSKSEDKAYFPLLLWHLVVIYVTTS